MNYYFITGTSKGLGKSLAEILIQDEDNIVYGLSRNNTIQHPNYHHNTIDLGDLNQADNFKFPTLNNPDKIILINNAGILGDVKRVGNINNKKMIACYHINLIAPSILTNNFIAAYGALTNEKIILNISSGAGRDPIDGWNVYCSSKAGLDMFSEVLNEEVKIDNSNIRVLSLAPGIIDTGMQDEIRKADKKAFSNIERFIDYKNQGDLIQPEITAQKVIRFIQENELAQKVICSVRDLTS
jgi:benzil reductase ((S)-benzoin forming)